MDLLFSCPRNKCNCWEALLVWGRWEGAVEVSPRHMSLASEIWWGQCLNSISWYFRLSRKVGTEPKLSDILNGSWLFDLLLVTLLKLSALSNFSRLIWEVRSLDPKYGSHIHPLCIEEEGLLLPNLSQTVHLFISSAKTSFPTSPLPPLCPDKVPCILEGPVQISLCPCELLSRSRQNHSLHLKSIQPSTHASWLVLSRCLCVLFLLLPPPTRLRASRRRNCWFYFHTGFGTSQTPD